MSIIQLKTISEICMVAGMIMMIIAGMVFVSLDVYKSWNMIHSPNYKIKNNRQSKKKYIETNTEYAVGEMQLQEETVRLEPQEMPDYIQEETMLLEDTANTFKVVYEITYIHTNEI